MKLLATTLFAGFAAAEWGVWVPNKGCNAFGNGLIVKNESEETKDAGATREELQTVCKDWCAAQSNEFDSYIAAGDPLCCETEHWTPSGYYVCYLFTGNQSDDDVSFISPDNDAATFDMMQFAYGSQNQEDSAEALKAAVAALAAIAVIMQ